MQMNNIKKSLKSSNGITLIALVITIIVLLILAGISIIMISGENGILQRATDAKTQNYESQIKERIRLAYNSALTKDIANYKSKVQKSTLEEELANEFPNETVEIAESADKKEWIITIDGIEENVPIGKQESLVNEADLNKLKEFFIGKTPDDWMKPNDIVYNDPDIIRISHMGIQFPEYAIYNNNYYMITLDEITAEGTDVQLLKDNTTTEVNEEYKPFISYRVKGYTPSAGGNWRLFYADSENVYLISDSIGSKIVKNEYEAALEAGEISDIGKALNQAYTNRSSWTLKSDGTNINSNIKAVSWLTRESNWSSYKMQGIANWAIGGPTLELWTKVYNTVFENNNPISPTIEENAVGYSNNISSGLMLDYTSTVLYGPSNDEYYCLASPSSLSDESIYKAGETRMAGGALVANNVSNSVYIRPLVSVPVSKVKNGSISFYSEW